MEKALIVSQQVMLIFFFIIVGIIANKANIIDEKSGATLSKISIMIVLPATMINSFQRTFQPEMLGNLGMVFILAVLTHSVSTTIAVFAVKKRPDSRYRIERFAVAFANSGFMAIPLVEAVVGDVGVFYISVFLSVFNIFTWTIGVSLLRGENKVDLKRALINPSTISFVIGFTLYILGVNLPYVLSLGIKQIAVMNTPLSMITVGVFLANIKILQVIKNKSLYYTSLLRLVAVPITMIFLLWLFRVQNFSGDGRNIFMTIVLACACPAAGSTVQFSTQYTPEHSSYGAEILAITTLFSLITLPLISYAVGWII